MDELFYYCALVGGTLLAIRTLMTLTGLGGDDVDFDADAADFDAADGDIDAHDVHDIKLLSVQAIVAFVTFFGLAGLLARDNELTTWPSAGVAIAAGIAAMYLVAWCMAALVKLNSSGNLRLERAIGCEGSVYIRVPAQRDGAGRVIVETEGRRVECRAITRGESLTPRTPIRVVRVVGRNTLEVEALPIADAPPPS